MSPQLSSLFIFRCGSAETELSAWQYRLVTGCFMLACALQLNQRVIHLLYVPAPLASHQM